MTPTRTPAASEHERLAREKRARLIVEEVVRQNVLGLKNLTEEEWEILGANSGLGRNPLPSAETREVVYAMLRKLKD